MSQLPFITSTVIFTSPLVVAVLLFATHKFKRKIRHAYRRQTHLRRMQHQIQVLKYAKDMSIALIGVEMLIVFFAIILTIQRMTLHAG